jgi:hypothetical protein
LCSIPELLICILGKTVAKVQSQDNEAVIQRAAGLGWRVRQSADQISLLLPQVLSLREVVDALDGTEVRSLSVQPVTLEDAYLEFVDAPDELIKIFTKTINQ